MMIAVHMDAWMRVMRTDIEPNGIPTESPLAAIKIETVVDYEKATARVAELAEHVEDSADEQELEALADAIMERDRRTMMRWRGCSPIGAEDGTDVCPPQNLARAW